MKIKFIVITILTAFILQGCDDQLEISQNDNITSETLYNTPAGALAGLAGAYSRVVSVYREAVINAQYPTNWTDEGFYNRKGARDMRKNNFTASEPMLRDIWGTYYEGISATNTLIVGLENSSLETSVKEEFIAEGRFLRAYLYFDLQKAFGGVQGIPMPLEETNKQLLPRTAGIDVYKQIVADLEFAEQYLPTAAEAVGGRASKSAARGLLARAYLYMASAPFNESGAYEKARDWSKKVIDDSYHELNPSYADIFNELARGNYETKETLFQIGFSFADLDSNQSSKIGSAFGIRFDDEACPNGADDLKGKGFGLTYATITLVLKYRADPDDERGLWNTLPYFGQRNNNCELGLINSQFQYPASKYRRYLEPNTTNTSYGSHHWPVVRLSEMYLIYAEAVNKITPGSTDALNAVNSVRNRAKATPLTVISDGAIQEERLLELCFEGQRKYDLVRWGLLEQKVNETKTTMENLAADPTFTNEDWTTFGTFELDSNDIPVFGDVPVNSTPRVNTMNPSFDYFDGYNDFNPSKHYILPIPEQELGVNTNLKQTTGW
ncbi:RagB/SusD family nutrient uptake outer membrane protein [Wocania ichthyoenteri]|uniref:RagB/SusD family nutrient uptake outer membrane protein n=1 Tax=Wocania ichthyoenteri TaxID=1230531 RepID=UPI00053D3434|nr:RagB/SusD family nutrient uptake outer membrane protein [Wocania ichthyoenteri]